LEAALFLTPEIASNSDPLNKGLINVERQEIRPHAGAWVRREKNECKEDKRDAKKTCAGRKLD